MLLNLIAIVACTVPYFLASAKETIHKDFPFISDSGRQGVAAALFSLFFTLYAFIFFIILTLRFEQIKAVYSNRSHKCLHAVNTVTYCIGMLACAGVWLLANFREKTAPEELMKVHNAGSVIGFALGTIYFLLQTIFSFFWKEVPGRTLVVNICRGIFSSLHFAFLAAFMVLLQNYTNTFDMTMRKNAAIMEWIFVFLVTLYPLTFIPEFYKANFKCTVDFSGSDREAHGNNPRLVLHESGVATNRHRGSDEQNSRLIEIEETQELLDGDITSDDNMLL